MTDDNKSASPSHPSQNPSSPQVADLPFSSSSYDSYDRKREITERENRKMREREGVKRGYREEGKIAVIFVICHGGTPAAQRVGSAAGGGAR
jgi:hypothetical protein